MSLNDKIKLLGEYGNEIAFGYNDSGCFWHMAYGKRGTGNRIDGCAHDTIDSDFADFEEAVDFFLAELESRHGKRESP